LSWVQKLYLIICKDQKELLLLLAKFVKKMLQDHILTIFQISVVGGWLHGEKGEQPLPVRINSALQPKCFFHL
jgi:hypothetical protein